jgi:hypothetical protein
VVVADERGFVQQTEFVDGRLFSLRLGPGTARIAAFTASGASDWTEVDLRPGLQTEVELVARPAGRLEIVSKDAEGKPLRAVVRATDARGLGHHAPLGIDITRFDGGAVPRDHVTRFGALPPGDYTVRGWSYDGRAGQRTVRVTAGETERVALVLGE